MSHVLSLRMLNDASNAMVDELVDRAQEISSRREAVEAFIRTIHGLPEVMNAELRQLLIYIGRAGASGALVRARWKYRLGQPEFKGAPSTVATIVGIGNTRRIMDERWETAAQRIVYHLESENALCVANVDAGSMGKKPKTKNSALYLVARLRRGVPSTLSEDAVRRALFAMGRDELMEDDEVRGAGLILEPDEADIHDVIESCKRPDCRRPRTPGNYGLCDHHR